MQTSWRGRIVGASALGLLLGCSSSNSAPPADDLGLPAAGGTGSGATGGTTSAGGSGGTGATGGSNTIMLGGSGGGPMAGSGGSSTEDPCKSKDCGVGQRCQAASG